MAINATLTAIPGANWDVPDTTAAHRLGQRAISDQGCEFIYLLANTAVTAEGYVVFIDTSWGCDMVTLTLTADTKKWRWLAVATCAVAAGEYCWFQIAGKANLRVAASCAAGVLLTATATAGVIDDAAGSGTEELVGITVTTAAGGAEATVAGLINHPMVGLTAA